MRKPLACKSAGDLRAIAMLLRVRRSHESCLFKYSEAQTLELPVGCAPDLLRVLPYMCN